MLNVLRVTKKREKEKKRKEVLDAWRRCQLRASVSGARGARLKIAGGRCVLMRRER